MKHLLKKYFHSVLNPEEFSRISDFLEDTKNDKVISGFIQPFWEANVLEDPNHEEPNPELKEKILQSVQQEENKSLKRKVKLLDFRLRIAAILVIGLIVSQIFTFRKASSDDPYKSELQTISTPYGAKANFKLPDGSLVWLNSGSTLSFQSGARTNRLVKLNGEAFFEVQKTGNPFIVTTNFGEIEVRGTFFNVNAFSGENFQTTLVQGAVTVKTNNGTKAIKLNPGQQAELEGKDLIVKNVETDLFDSWKYGKLIFRNEYLPVVAKRLERWYNVKIELANDKRLSEISYTGTLEMETFSEVLQLLRITAPINYSYDEKTRIIKITYRKT
jgi:ferric-dicitrate binding protein FerR (iron transport regulator)